ncbi:MAG: hypothetical protein KDB58_07685 [Solirubrobacterales bacterium]|nr:hypothetical protein [Solirubrobacterales bacterium]MCB8971425.1 hypothetical protein [Thermoleophilales bacterium]MCO5327517.1 hypothetical protein [Solirubrobacterales bacterium]
MELLVRLILAGVLVAAAGAKLARPRQATAAMATHGFRTPLTRRIAFAFVVAAELALAVGVALGSDDAAYGAALLMALFALTLGGEMLRGKAGEPCGCFGGDSRVGWGAIARNVVLAAAFAAVPSLPESLSLSTDGWLALGLAVALLACAGLALAVLALAREVGMLRLRLGPEAALEIAHEGPEVGGRSALVERFSFEPRNELALAVFTSEGCHVCRALEPAVDSLRREPALAVEVFPEGTESALWEELAIPGAPYAVALDRGGTVGAKGTFNNLAQLESILATAERRGAERRRVEALGV